MKLVLTAGEQAAIDALKNFSSYSKTEVATPFEMVRQTIEQIDDAVIANPDTKYFFCGSKDGKYPATLFFHLKKNVKGNFASELDKEKHILKNQIYVDCVSRFAKLLTKRTLYGREKANAGKYASIFDDEDGNVWFTGIDGRTDRDALWWGSVADQNASKCGYRIVNGIRPKEMFNVQFDVIIGNPPYQVPTSGRSQSNPQSQPIYHQMVMTAASLKPKQISMIIPSRWMTAASKGGWDIREFRQFMAAGHIKEIHDFEKSSLCFGNSVELKGGVCYWTWQADYCGDAIYVEHHADGTIHSEMRPLMLDGYDCVIRRAEIIAVLDHLKSLEMDSFSKVVSSMDYFGKIRNDDLKDARQLDESDPNAIKVYGHINHCAASMIVDKSIATRHFDDIDKPKLFVPKNAGGAGLAKDKFHFIRADSGSAATSTYLMIGPFNTLEERDSCLSYLQTKFAHFCIGCIKSSITNCSTAYRYLPLVDFTKGPWSEERIRKELHLTDKHVRVIDSLVWV